MSFTQTSVNAVLHACAQLAKQDASGEFNFTTKEAWERAKRAIVDAGGDQVRVEPNGGMTFTPTGEKIVTFAGYSGQINMTPVINWLDAQGITESVLADLKAVLRVEMESDIDAMARADAKAHGGKLTKDDVVAAFTTAFPDAKPTGANAVTFSGEKAAVRAVFKQLNSRVASEWDSGSVVTPKSQVAELGGQIVATPKLGRAGQWTAYFSTGAASTGVPANEASGDGWFLVAAGADGELQDLDGPYDSGMAAQANLDVWPAGTMIARRAAGKWGKAYSSLAAEPRAEAFADPSDQQELVTFKNWLAQNPDLEVQMSPEGPTFYFFRDGLPVAYWSPEAGAAFGDDEDLSAELEGAGDLEPSSMPEFEAEWHAA